MDMEFLGNVLFVAGAIVLMLIGERLLRPKSTLTQGLPTVPEKDLAQTVEEPR